MTKMQTCKGKTFDITTKNAETGLYNIALNTIKDGPKNFLIGSGPATWANDFLKFKSVDLNENSAFWNRRLNYSGNYISNSIASLGVLGLLSYSMIIFFSLFSQFLTC